MDQIEEIKEFTRIRRILFAVFNKSNQGQINAFEYLEGYNKKLGQRSYTGLKAELGFFQKYRKEFRLTPALDCGDHVTEISNAQEYERDRMEYQQSLRVIRDRQIFLNFFQGNRIRSDGG